MKEYAMKRLSSLLALSGVVAAPFDVKIPDTLKDVLFITKDSKRFAGSAGWGYAQFNHDAASGSFTPEGSGSDCGHACHTIVKAKDYIFTAYGKH
jgi:hypothetical protein